jgi:hypothetical protein
MHDDGFAEMQRVGQRETEPSIAAERRIGSVLKSSLLARRRLNRVVELYRFAAGVER